MKKAICVSAALFALNIGCVQSNRPAPTPIESTAPSPIHPIVHVVPERTPPPPSGALFDVAKKSHRTLVGDGIAGTAVLAKIEFTTAGGPDSAHHVVWAVWRDGTFVRSERDRGGAPFCSGHLAREVVAAQLENPQFVGTPDFFATGGPDQGYSILLLEHDGAVLECDVAPGAEARAADADAPGSCAAFLASFKSFCAFEESMKRVPTEAFTGSVTVRG